MCCLANNITHFIRIPNQISVFYFKRKRLIIFKSLKTKRFCFIDSQLNFLLFKNKILIFNDFFKKLSQSEIKSLNSKKKFIFYFFKQLLLETQTNIYDKLNLVGVGFKVFETVYPNVLMFKLGFSHPVYISFVNKNIKVKVLKNTKLLFTSISYFNSKQLVAKIRNVKLPECYKGKGIFYNKEKIKIREGKKT